MKMYQDKNHVMMYLATARYKDPSSACLSRIISIGLEYQRIQQMTHLGYVSR